jgi:serine/threonine protein phosphatase 1
MRTLAIGDIHGCLTALQTLEAAVPFADDDRIVTLGDYVDKGPDVPGVLDWLVERAEAFGDRLVPIRGNHDLLMLEARDGRARFDTWLQCNGDATLAGYGLPPTASSLARIPDEHWALLESTRLFAEDAKHFYVHGNVDPDLPLTEQPDYLLLWEKFYDPPPHASGKTMVCGHTSQKTGQIADLGHAVCIDTWACGGGWLTALDPDTGEYWQADQLGRVQTGRR